jgi:hypothetical protein
VTDLSGYCVTAVTPLVPVGPFLSCETFPPCFMHLKGVRLVPRKECCRVLYASQKPGMPAECVYCRVGSSLCLSQKLLQSFYRQSQPLFFNV